MAKQQETDFVKEALLDIQSIKAALTENAKETLRAIAREEIDSVINESLSEDDDFEEEDVEGEMEGSEEGETDVDANPYDGETEGDELDVDSLEGDDELEIELDDTEMGGEDEVDMDDMDVVDVDLSDAPDEEEIDLTDASDDMVLSVYKELTDTDEIEVIGDEIHMDIKEPGKFILKPKQSAVEIKVDDELGMEEEMEMEGEMGMEEEMDETIYEVYMDEEADEMEEGYEMENAVEEGEVDEEEMLDEAIPVGNAQARRVPGRNTPIKGAGAKGVKVESKTSEYEKLLTESKKLKKENEIFKENLINFRKTLAETALYNFNLTYVTKIFLEHATTKDEKISIMERFDGVKSIKESKALYDKVVNEMGSRKTISESVSKLDRSVASGKSNLSEHTAYVDNETARIVELMERVEGKKLL
jgi:hypothetical protein